MPVRAVQSESAVSASKTIDLDFNTTATIHRSGGQLWPWLKISLGKVHCVEKVVLYPEEMLTHTNWTCSRADCVDCDGDECPILSVEVSSLDPTLNLPPFPDCIYGDSVQLRGGDDLNKFMVKEIAIIEKHGETFLYVPTDGQLQFNMFSI